MGIYVFTARFLFEQLLPRRQRAGQHARLRPRHHSRRSSTRIACSPFRFLDENRKQDAYWRDVGTLDAYYEANMDLISVDPQLNMYDDDWPIRTYQPNLPPPKFVFAAARTPGAQGRPWTASSAPGSIVSGGQSSSSILGPPRPHQQLRPGRGLDPVRRRRRGPARQDPPGDHRQGRAHSRRHEIGYDLDLDRRRGFTVTPGGVVVIPRLDRLDEVFARNG